ncbi:hypothetical protein [Candidatus Babela massiliensis]|uniref:Beta-propeller domain fused to N-terminal C-rich domain n=1 Tax=Candidatus Babela massiliensis TaxID=673862 RepID=V6DFT4_9BACT|nr:hypothetical protein [Candidatus Babela massiliensis]CDK30430.1 Beta-propeller domain fused to N-terminal C-rich domain [Candidatus Babela massiliensis]
MKKFITTAFCVTLLLSSFEKIYAKNYDSSSNSVDNFSDKRDYKSCNSCSNDCDLAVCESSSSCESYSSCDNLTNNYDCTNYCQYTCNNNCDNSCDSCDEGCNGGNCSLCCATPVRTAMHFRSQGANTARELVGWQWEINLPFMCNNYGAAYFAYEYQRSFNDKIIANALFGNCRLNFSGSAVANRSSNDLLADNFGLSSNFQGSIRFNPRIQNHIFDFGYYQGLDCWIQGSYLRLHAPVVLTYWELRPCETSCNTTTTDFDTCYVDSTSNQPTAPAQSILQALTGNFLFGDMQTPWCAGKFDPCSRKRVGLADIDVILGYNFLNTDCYHLGLYAQLVMPTGKKYKDRFIFDPVVGNYGHFEVGGGVSAHAVLWSSNDHNLAAFLEGNLTHMCKTHQCRLFDFQNAGAFSRYLLLKEYDASGVYTGRLINATCFNNRRVDVRVNIKGDASVKLAYRWCGWGADLGYNIYGHSSESVKFRDDSCVNPAWQYAIKGSAPVCCSSYPVACVPSGDTYTQMIFPDGATLPTGTLACSVNTQDGSATCEATNPALSSYTVNTTLNNGAQPSATAFAASPITISSPEGCSVCLNQTVTAPINISQLTTEGFVLVDNNSPTRFVTPGDFNIRSAESIGVLTHKIFAHLNYVWYDRCGYNPQLGIGGEAEFNDNHINDLNCKNAGLSQWGVWLKGNISF